MLLFVSPAYPANNTGKNSRLLKGMDKIIADCSRWIFHSGMQIILEEWLLPQGMPTS